MGLPTKARCGRCQRPLHRAWIPNRGWVMAHGHGERQICDRQWLFKRMARNNARPRVFLKTLRDILFSDK